MGNGLKSRGHWAWRLYEYATAFMGWSLLASLALIIWNSVAAVFDLPPFLKEFSFWYHATFIGSLTWVIKADFVKYRITMDPRDEPFRKWFSFKHAQRYKPGEVVVVPDGFDGDRSRMVYGVCRTCGSYHGFLPDSELERECGVYGCKATVRPLGSDLE